MSSIKNSWTQGRSKESHPPALCSPSFLQNSPLLDFQLLMGLSIFIAVSLAIFHPQVWVIETAHLHHRGGWGELPLRGRDSPRAQACDWSDEAIPGSWLAAGNTGLIRPAAGLTARPNIPKSSCNSNILIFYQWLANSNRHKIKLTLSTLSSTQLQIWNNIIIICLWCDAITPGLSPECEENCKFD